MKDGVNEMNDTLRELFSYGKFIIPIMKVKKEIKPERVQWGNKDQYFLLYPAKEKKSDTLVIYIHGGGWNSGSPRDLYFIGQRVALEGYDCIMPGYRKAPKFHCKEIVEDVFQDYVRIRQYLKEKSRAYSRMIVMGSSAGAHLGALLCFDREYQEKYNIEKEDFDKFICLAGPLCFDYPQTRICNKLMKGLFGTKNLTIWKKWEPISKLKEYQKIKLLIIHSKHDGLIEYNQALAFVKKAQMLGMETEFYDVNEVWNTHSAYSAGIFLKERKDSPTIEKVFSGIEHI